MFGATEHDGEFGFFGLALFFKKLLQEIHFVSAIHEAEFLFDAFGGGDFWSDGHTGWVTQDFLCEGNDVWGECG
jgi:hypothetical protein